MLIIIFIIPANVVTIPRYVLFNNYQLVGFAAGDDPAGADRPWAEKLNFRVHFHERVFRLPPRL